MIKIVADTTCSLPQPIVDQYDITLIPVYLTIDGQTFRDREELSSTDFYLKLRGLRDLPTTLQPSVDDFKVLYDRLLNSTPGATIVSIHLSAALSGTVASAQAAASAFPENSVRVVDTRSLGTGHGLMVRQAAQIACEPGATVDAVLQALQEVRASLKGYLMLDTLEYVAKSGRIGRAARLLGGLFNIKPVLTMSEGHIEPHQRCRSRPEAFDVMAKLAIEAARPQARFQVGIMHTGSPDEASVLGARLREEIEPEVLMVCELSGAIGTFFGPDAVGLSWCSPPARLM